MIHNLINQFRYNILSEHVLSTIDCAMNHRKFIYIIKLKEVVLKHVFNFFVLFFIS